MSPNDPVFQKLKSKLQPKHPKEQEDNGSEEESPEINPASGDVYRFQTSCKIVKDLQPSIKNANLIYDYFSFSNDFWMAERKCWVTTYKKCCIPKLLTQLICKYPQIKAESEILYTL